MKTKIEEIIERVVANILGCDSTQNGKSQTEIQEDLGQNIVVLDRGFVYVGEVTRVGDYIVIENARNIRIWGTSEGLGQLRSGPLKDTKLDVVGSVKAPYHALQHLIACKGF